MPSSSFAGTNFALINKAGVVVTGAYKTNFVIFFSLASEHKKAATKAARVRVEHTQVCNANV